jgi:hypothetical protein
VDGVFRGFQLLLATVGLGLFGFGAFGIGNTAWKVSEARGWPTTQGIVLNRDWRSSTAVGRNGSSWRFEPEIRYRYTVSGQEYVGENVYPATAEQWTSQEELSAYMDATFPARGPVTVSYDPAQPARAAIILRGSYWTAATLLICGLIALAGVWCTWFISREPDMRKGPPPK